MCWSGMIDNVRQPQEGRALSRPRRERPTWSLALPCVWRIRRSVLQFEDGGIDVRINVLRNVAQAEKTHISPEKPHIASRKGGARASDSNLCHGANEGNREGNIERIIKAINLNPRITIAELEKVLSLSHATIERAQKSLQMAGRLRRVGGTRGHWEIVEG